MVPDPSLRNAILDAKMMLTHGKYHLKSGHLSRLDRLLAIHHAHHAVELTLREKVSQLGERPGSFPELVKALKNHNVTIPYERELTELNSVRNLMQHHGTATEDREVYRLVSASESFMREFCSNSWGLSYDELSVVDLVENKNAREALRRGYEEFAKREFMESAAYARLSIEQVRWLTKDKFGIHMFGKRIGDTPILPQDEEMTEPLESLWRALSQTAEVALFAPFATDYEHVRELTKSMLYSFHDGKMEISKVIPLIESTEELSEPEAAFCLELALEFLLWAQQSYDIK
jgi:uncharacterized protein YutE (UPF0331/DUF86 family)